jgi:PAS domain S-box-containing protein
MHRPPKPYRSFLQHFTPLAFLITLLAGGFWLVEQHGHQTLLNRTGVNISNDQAVLLLARFNTHQFESIGAATILALLAAALIAWHTARSRLRQLLVEQENREQLRKIELLLDSTLEGIYAVDCVGQCTMANRSCAQLLGYDGPHQLLGREMHELIHHTRPDGTPYPLDECKVHMIVGTGAAVTTLDEVFWRKDGSSLPVAYTAHPIKDGDQIIGVVCAFMDLSEQRQAEAQMTQLEEQLRQAQKMEAIGQLASGVAHDFNNILQVISGNTQLLQLVGDTDPAAQQHRLHEIIKAVERGVTLTGAMLAFARRQAIALRPVELNDLLRESVPLARNLLTKTQRLELQLHPEPLMVTADATLLQQVLFNLLTNARDAMPEGGTVTVGTAWSDQVPDRAVGGEQLSAGPFALLWVQDTGQGISPAIRDKIFEPFFSTKGVGKGTGLGLAMIYGTIKQHNGCIHIESEPGQGCRVTIYLPCIGQHRSAS